jgi:hypothetical protein
MGPYALRVNFHRNRAFGSRAIRWQTRGRVNHVSVSFHPGTGCDGFIEATGAGVVFRPVPRPLTDLYAAFLVSVAEAGYQAALAFAHAQHGKRYDWLSLARFVTRQQESRASSGRWFCSELAFVLLRKAGLTPLLVDPWRVDPERLFQSPLWATAESLTGPGPLARYLVAESSISLRSQRPSAHVCPLSNAP